MRHFIRLTKVLREGRKLTYQFESSLKFFERHEFYVLYEKDFPPAGESMLSVPFAAVMAALSWMTGADLEIDILDEDYEKSLRSAREYFHKWFSKNWSFAGEIRIRRTEKNTGSAAREGTLYSGGLDALTTYLHQKDKKPLLFSFFGADIPMDQTKLIEACKKSFREFAANEGVELCCIESDFWTLFNHPDLKKWTHNWWGQASHAMILSAMTAPYSYRELGRLWIASSHVAGTANYGWGSDYDLDNHLRWGSTQLEEDFHETERIDKIAFLKRYPEYYRYLRVCFTWWLWTGEAINCSRCEKCYRTMCELILHGIDPTECNLLMTNNTFADMRKALEKPHAYYSFFGRSPSAVDFWKEICILSRRGSWLEIHGAGDFFKWLAGSDRIDKMKDTPAGRFKFELRKIRWHLMSKLSR